MDNSDPYSSLHPAMPNRWPLTPFMIFAGEIRSIVLQDACGVENDVENGRELVKRWKLLAKEERDRYFLRAERDRAFLDEQRNSGRRGASENKKRKTRDPDMPRAAKNAYHHFQLSVRPRIKKKHPELNFQDIGRRIGVEWKELSAEGKQPYEDMALQDKIRYSEAMKAYEASKGIKPGTSRKTYSAAGKLKKVAKRKKSHDDAATLKMEAAHKALSRQGSPPSKGKASSSPKSKASKGSSKSGSRSPSALPTTEKMKEAAAAAKAAAAAAAAAEAAKSASTASSAQAKTDTTSTEAGSKSSVPPSSKATAADSSSNSASSSSSSSSDSPTKKKAKLQLMPDGNASTTK